MLFQSTTTSSFMQSDFLDQSFSSELYSQTVLHVFHQILQAYQLTCGLHRSDIRAGEKKEPRGVEMSCTGLLREQRHKAVVASTQSKAIFFLCKSSPDAQKTQEM